jgi:hypothetical protein
MSVARKKQLIDHLFKAGNLEQEFSSWLSYTLFLALNKFPGLTQAEIVDINNRFGGQEYLARVKNLYDQIFSEQEIEEILNFWSSPTGRKLVCGDFAETQKAFHTKWALSVDAACHEICTSRQDGKNENDKARAS